MARTRMEIDPYVNDPGRWAHSLINLTELLLPCLDAAGARSVVEVGAYAGDLTRVLLAWAQEADARVWAIDPSPQDSLVELDRENQRLELVRATSLDALPQIPPTEAAVIDGDHNYYTVTEELRRIEAWHPDGQLPLLFFHDVGWPHGRRDDYFNPDLIPAEQRHPVTPGEGIFPGVPGTFPDGLPYGGSAAREGGPRNGVLTAVEDFVDRREDVQLAVVPIFFGLGVVWPRDAPWAAEVGAILEPWDRNPMLARLEENRVLHLAESQVRLARNYRQGAVLRRLLASSAFSVAERLSRLRRRAGVAPASDVVSKAEIRRALGER